MAKFTVLFEGPRVYNGGHTKGERRAWGLHVFADTAEGAKRHALQTTQGRARVSEVQPGFHPVDPPPDDAPPPAAPHVEDVSAQERPPL